MARGQSNSESEVSSILYGRPRQASRQRQELDLETRIPLPTWWPEETEFDSNNFYLSRYIENDRGFSGNQHLVILPDSLPEEWLPEDAVEAPHWQPMKSGHLLNTLDLVKILNANAPLADSENTFECDFTVPKRSRSWLPWKPPIENTDPLLITAQLPEDRFFRNKRQRRYYRSQENGDGSDLQQHVKLEQLAAVESQVEQGHEGRWLYMRDQLHMNRGSLVYVDKAGDFVGAVFLINYNPTASYGLDFPYQT